MKKLLALAAAGAFAATTASAADLSINGDFEYYVKAQGENQTFTTGDADVKFSVSDQLTDAIKLDYFSAIKQGEDGSHLLSLGGAFGTFQIGTDNGSVADDFDEVAAVAEQNGGGHIDDGNAQNGAINYLGKAGPFDFRVGYNMDNDGGLNNESREALSVGLQYQMGPVKIGYGMADVEDKGNNNNANPQVISLSGNIGPISAGYEAVSNQAGNDDHTIKAFGAKYAVDSQLGLFVEQHKEKTTATTVTGTSAGLTYKIGGVKTYLQVTDDDGASTKSQTIMGLEYSF